MQLSKEIRMAKIKSLVRVKAFKTFEYVKSMLHKDLFIQDAINKARNDMQVFVDEIVQNDHAQLEPHMFQYEAEEYLGYKFRTRQGEEKEQYDSVSVAKAARALTTSKMETKHGSLNPELNPQLFEHVEEIRTPDGQVIVREEQWFMLEAIEREFYEVYDEFTNLLRNIR